VADLSPRAEHPWNADGGVETEILGLRDARRIMRDAEQDVRRWNVVPMCPIGQGVPQVDRHVLVRTGVADKRQRIGRTVRTTVLESDASVVPSTRCGSTGVIGVGILPL
jgi:hypothetical protein